MGGKQWIKGLVLFLMVPCLWSSEIVRISLLERTRGELTVSRDLFEPGRAVSPAPGDAIREAVPKVRKPPVPDSESIASSEDRMRRNMVFEGFIRRNDRLTGILSVNGEYFIVEAGDQILDRIQVQEVREKDITVVVDGNRLVVPFQGVEENEK